MSSVGPRMGQFLYNILPPPPDIPEEATEEDWKDTDDVATASPFGSDQLECTSHRLSQNFTLAYRPDTSSSDDEAVMLEKFQSLPQEEKNPKAIYDIGIKYFSGSRNIKPNIPEAIKYLKEAAKDPINKKLLYLFLENQFKIVDQRETPAMFGALDLLKSLIVEDQKLDPQVPAIISQSLDFMTRMNAEIDCLGKSILGNAFQSADEVQMQIIYDFLITILEGNFDNSILIEALDLLKEVDGKEYFTRLDQEGRISPHDQYLRLGFCYLSGIGTDPHFNTARRYFTEVIENKEHRNDIYSFALSILRGERQFKKTILEALECLKILGSAIQVNGYLSALYFYACEILDRRPYIHDEYNASDFDELEKRYREGALTYKEDALRALKEASDGGHFNSSYRLARWYESCENYDEAIKLYTATSPHINCLSEIALCMFQKSRVQENRQKALDLIMTGVSRRNLDCLYLLGTIYLNGNMAYGNRTFKTSDLTDSFENAMVKDIDLATAYFHLASIKGGKQAQDACTSYIDLESEICQQTKFNKELTWGIYIEAKKLATDNLKMTDKVHDIDAISKLRCHCAYYLLKSGEEHRNNEVSESAESLSEITSAAKDLKTTTALSWLSQADMDPDAMHLLGIIYYSGELTIGNTTIQIPNMQADPDLGKAYLQCAIAQGCDKASKDLSYYRVDQEFPNCEGIGNGNFDKIIALYNKAIKFGNMSAHADLAEYLFRINQDPRVAQMDARGHLLKALQLTPFQIDPNLMYSLGMQFCDEISPQVDPEDDLSDEVNMPRGSLCLYLAAQANHEKAIAELIEIHKEKPGYIDIDTHGITEFFGYLCQFINSCEYVNKSKKLDTYHLLYLILKDQQRELLERDKGLSGDLKGLLDDEKATLEQKIISSLTIPAELNHPQAQYELGMIYKHKARKGENDQLILAFRYLEAAKEQNYPGAEKEWTFVKNLLNSQRIVEAFVAIKARELEANLKLDASSDAAAATINFIVDHNLAEIDRLAQKHLAKCDKRKTVTFPKELVIGPSPSPQAIVDDEQKE